jgi:anti-sigma B factor antagonist
VSEQEEPTASDSGQDSLSTATQVSTYSDEGGAVIRLVGEIDWVLAEDLEMAVQDAVALDLPVVVDVSEVTFLDSTGLALLGKLVNAGRRPQLRGASRYTVELLELSGLRQQVDIG